MQQQFCVMMLELLDLIIPTQLRRYTGTQRFDLRIVAGFTAIKEPDCTQFPYPAGITRRQCDRIAGY